MFYSFCPGRESVMRSSGTTLDTWSSSSCLWLTRNQWPGLMKFRELPNWGNLSCCLVKSSGGDPADTSVHQWTEMLAGLTYLEPLWADPVKRTARIEIIIIARPRPCHVFMTISRMLSHSACNELTEEVLWVTFVSIPRPNPPCPMHWVCEASGVGGILAE